MIGIGAVLISLSPLTVSSLARTAQPRFKAPELYRHVTTLASDRMEGRGIGTRGIELAAQYIAKQFAAYGLQPAGDAGTFFQKFRVSVGVKMVDGNRLRLNDDTLRSGRDFAPINFSANGAVSGEVVFAGFGISAPEIGYDDYAGLDAAGKIVLVLTREPRERDQDSPFRDPSAYRYTEVRYKLLNARNHGARGVLVVDPPDDREADEKRRDLRFDAHTPGASGGIVAAFLHYGIADRLLKRANTTLRRQKAAIDASLQSASLSLPGVEAELGVALEKVFGDARNVVGVLSGTHPKLRGEAVVIGAHYDHLGYGGITSLAPHSGRQVHNGADDNASGVAGVLGLAKAFAKQGGAPRSIIFAAFSAEELGILGSNYFVKHAPVPIADVAAMINMDMIGRLRSNTLHVQGVDTSSGFRALVKDLNNPLGLTLKFLGDGYGPSDHTPFYAAKMPVLFFFTGPHSDYHKPGDDVDKINAAGMAQTLELVYRTAAHLARAPRPQYVAAASPPPGRAGGRRRGYGPRFGIIPDFADHEGGVLISGVRSKSPAAGSGLRKGDVITKFAGVPVYNLYDFTYVLRSKRAGDRIEVVYQRQGNTYTGKATLERRR